MKRVLNSACFLILTMQGFEAPVAQEWVCPLGQESGVVFFQGASLSQVEAATYMKDSHFISPTTQERIASDTGISVFKNVCVDPELPEVILAARDEPWWQSCAHPIKSFEQNLVRKSYASSGIHITAQINSSKIQTLAAHTIDRTLVTLGQMPDVETHQERVKNFSLRFGNTPQIWHGTSRGAAVTLIAAALAHKNSPDSLKTVRLLLLEGCYGSVPNTLQMLFNSQIAIAGIEAYFSTYYAYKKDGITPFDVLKHFPKHISTAFITSKTDKQVPQAETEKLVKELVNNGHENIYLLILEDSSHGNYVASNYADAQKYQSFVHALYQELYLPYYPAYALAGMPVLAMAKKNAQALKNS